MPDQRRVGIPLTKNFSRALSNFIRARANLRSAIELDKAVVKSFHFEVGDPLYDHIIYNIAEGAETITKELNIETVTDILEKMCENTYKREAKQILKTLSQWRAFCVVFNKGCNIKFLLADPKKRNVLPRGRLFLFSATRLAEQELVFYCDIPKEILRTTGIRKTKFISKENVDYHYIECESDSDKIECVSEIINQIDLPTLILLNNNSARVSVFMR